MNLWGRRLVLFGLVLAAGLVVAHVIMIRRGGTSHALVQASTGSVAAPASQAKQGWAGANSASAGVTEAVVTPPTAIAPPVLANPQKGAPAVLSAAAGPAGKAGKIPGAAALIATTTRTFHDKNYKVSFDYPAMWTFTEKDHEISTFRLDAKRAEKNTTMRAVTAIPENPFPASTFTGAYVYLSVTPHSNDAKCAVQAAPEAEGKKREVSQLGGVSFMHGHDEQKSICTVERDEIYTTLHKGACYRFDLAMNNFCGGEVSGVKDVTRQELDIVLSKMESIAGTVRFDPK